LVHTETIGRPSARRARSNCEGLVDRLERVVASNPCAGRPDTQAGRKCVFACPRRGGIAASTAEAAAHVLHALEGDVVRPHPPCFPPRPAGQAADEAGAGRVPGPPLAAGPPRGSPGRRSYVGPDRGPARGHLAGQGDDRVGAGRRRSHQGPSRERGPNQAVGGISRGRRNRRLPLYEHLVIEFEG